MRAKEPNNPPRLVLVTDRHRSGGDRALLKGVERALEAGLPAVLFREKDLSEHTAEPLLCTLRELTRSRGALLYVTGRPHLAAALGADGLHLPEALDAPSRREWDGPLTLAAHNQAGLDRAKAVGAHFALLAPLFPTRSHPQARALGLEGFKSLADRSPVPILALGGVTPANASAALQAGAAGVACIDALLDTEDPGMAVRAFLEALEPGTNRA